MYNYNWDNPGHAEWSHLAGFFQADGCISVTRMVRGMKMPQLEMSISNYDVRILETALRVFGCGRVSHNMWFLSGNQQVAEALRCVRPYLIMKREQVDVALKIAERPHTHSGMSKEERQKEYAVRFELQEKLRALKLRTNWEPATEEDRADALWVRS